MAKDTASSMGTGGSGGIFSRKTELVADLTSAFKTLNQELEKTKKLSEDISKNLKGAFPASGSGNLLGSSFGTSTGTKNTDENNGTGGSGSNGGGLKNFALGALKFGLQAGGLAMQALPSVQEAFEQDLLRSRFGFFGGKNANATQMQMARQGTTTDPLDAARASMIGATQGLMPGLKNFSSIASSAATVSNLMPGVGVSGGMQAMGALNQGKNVNMLRMIGINVRGADGLQRGFEDIANDLWKSINSQKTGSAKISKEDLSMSLQPGNALASMMDQYFGNDPVLRQGVISALYQKAGGGSFTKESLKQAGATTGAVESMSDRNAASLNVNQALAPSVLTGFEKANELLASASDKLADAARSAGIIGDIIRAAAATKGFTDTVASSGNGAGAGAMGMLGNLAGSAFGSFFGSKGAKGATNIFKGGPKSFFGKGLNLAKGFGSKVTKVLPRISAGRAAAAALTYAGLEQAQKYLNENADVPDWVRTSANIAFDAGQGATTGFIAAGPGGAVVGTGAGIAGSIINPYGEGEEYGKGGGSEGAATGFIAAGPGGAVVGTGAGIAGSIINPYGEGEEYGKGGGSEGAATGFIAAGPGGAVVGTGAGIAGSIINPYGKGEEYGEGSGSDDVATAARGMIYPLSGRPPITSAFGKVRHLTFNNGQRSPSYGKPHGGIDFGVPEGTPVYAVTDGVVDATNFDAPGFGNYIKTLNSDGTENFFGHLSRKLVEGGARVKAGDIVGYSGNTGSSTGPHLHFEVRKDANKLDPMAYLSGAEANSLTAGAIPPSSGNNLTLRRGAGDLIMQPMGGEGLTPAPVNGMFNRGSDSPQTINYGGVTITFNMPEKSAGDVKAIAAEVKRVLSNDSIREKAVNK
jgi:murein DD-endopeptidase MepM/ murein hydrolase activator NlpD